VFQSKIVNSYIYDKRHCGRLDRVVQTIGNVEIILEHPTKLKAFQNVLKGKEELSIIFRDFQHEDTRSHVAIGFERTSMEL